MEALIDSANMFVKSSSSLITNASFISFIRENCNLLQFYTC